MAVTALPFLLTALRLRMSPLWLAPSVSGWLPSSSLPYIRAIPQQVEQQFVAYLQALCKQHKAITLRKGQGTGGCHA